MEEVADEDGDVAPAEGQEGGKYWRLQAHWPATSKSVSRVFAVDIRSKLTPINLQSSLSPVSNLTPPIRIP